MKLLFFVNGTLDSLLSKAYFPLVEISAFDPSASKNTTTKQDKICDDKRPKPNERFCMTPFM